MKSGKPSSFKNQSGFTIVEILVGLVIGLLLTLVIMQVFTVFEGQKRTTSGTADAQTNGSTALYTIARELKMSGYGLFPATDSPLECTAPIIDAATGVTGLSPVTITDGGTGAGASDSITIRYGTTPTGGTPTPIALMAGATATVGNNLACQLNDIAIIINAVAPSCNVTRVTGLIGTTGIQLQNIAGAAADPKINISCLGAWNEITYRVNNGNLERNLVPNITDIVNIQAQYGIAAAGLSSSNANFNQIVQWVDATGATWAVPTVADRNRIKAIRIAVVARNGLLEKENVSTACSSTTTASPTGLCAWDATSAAPIIASPAPSINLGNDPDWRRYRYRVFETIIPLRNMIWSKPTL
ncbi:MAG: PilW family protein [Nitrosomonadales bacterium]|nr:PilW family protein [Nitrosomonadales bacterium]